MLTRRRRVLGLVVVLGAVAFAWFWIAKPDPLRHDEVVEAIFDRVQGIAQVQRNVRVAGVNVGTIGTIRRVGNHAEVQMLLDQHIPIYRDATAALRPHTPFEGTAFIDLNPGTAGAGLLGSAPLPLSQTTVFVSAGAVLSTFTAPVRRGFQVIVGQLSRALAAPGQHGLSAALRNSPQLLQDTAVVAPALRGPHLTELRALMPELSSSINALAGRGDQLARIARGANATLSAVTDNDAVPLGQSISTLPTTLADIQLAGDRIAGVLRAADGAARTLPSILTEIPPTALPLARLLRTAAPVLPSATPTLRRFAQTLRALAASTPGFGTLLRSLGQIGLQLRYLLVPALDSRTALGLPTYLQLLAATTGFTGVLSSYVSPTQVGNGLATGHDLRFTLQGPTTLPLGALDIPCSAITEVNPKAVAVVEELGLCTG